MGVSPRREPVGFKVLGLRGMSSFGLSPASAPCSQGVSRADRRLGWYSGQGVSQQSGRGEGGHGREVGSPKASDQGLWSGSLLLHLDFGLDFGF